MPNKQNKIIKGKLRNDLISKGIIFTFAISGVAILLVMFAMILREAFPAYKAYGFLHMYFSADFSDKGGYGIWGGLSITLVTSLLAVIIALPIAMRVAIFLKFRIKKGQKIIQSIINVLAGVPSVIFGIFALKTFGQITQLFGYQSHTTIINATLTLTIMIFPTMVSMIYNQLKLTSTDLLNSSIALGNTTTYSIYKVVKKSIKSGVIVSSIVALGRAIGETMALSIILSTSPLPNPFANGIHEFFGSSSASLGVMIARLMFTDSADPAIRSALFAAGVALFVVVMILVIGANRLSSKRIIANQNPLKIKDIYDRQIYPASSIYYFVIGFHYLTLPLRLARFYITWFIEKLIRGVKYSALFLAKPIYKLIYPKGYTTNGELYVKVSRSSSLRIFDYIRIGLEIISFGIVMGSIFWIVLDIFSLGIPAWDAKMWSFTYQEKSGIFGTVTRPGVILNSMIFTIVLIVMSIGFAIFFAIGTALYLSEYGSNKKAGKVIKFFLDSLGGTPSILFGIFGVIMFRQTLGLGVKGGFSLIAGGLTMTIVILPTFTRSMEQVLSKVPQELRNASYALGASKFETIRKVVLPQAIPGIVTGIILSAGRVISETAPVYLTIGMLGNNSILINGEGWTMTTKILYNQIYDIRPMAETIKESYAIAAASILMVATFIVLAETIEPAMRKRPLSNLIKGKYNTGIKNVLTFKWRQVGSKRRMNMSRKVVA